MDLQSPVINFGLAASLLSAIFIFGVLLHAVRHSTIYEPSVSLPRGVLEVFPELASASSSSVRTLKSYAVPAHPPWNKIARSSVQCLANDCLQGVGYVAVLPLQDTVYLTTQQHFLTGNPFTYPVATVLDLRPVLGTRGPFFIVDAQPSENVIGGLLPLVQFDGTPLNMSTPNLTNLSGVRDGNNITGDFAHSFVVINSTGQDVYMPTSRVTGEPAAYWHLAPGSNTLMWPATRYFDKNSTPVGLHSWNASALPTLTYEIYASVAEITMYTDLRPKAPLPNET
jgi:hypothetical protein